MAPKPRIVGDLRAKIIGALQAGADMAIAAKAMGVDRKTIYRTMERDPSFADEVREARDFADERVEKSLFDSAMKGNVTAMIFWLKNRKPKVWRDQHDLVIERGGDDGIYRSQFADGQDVYAPGDPPLVSAPTDTGSIQ